MTLTPNSSPRPLLAGSATAVLLGGAYDGATVSLMIRRILPSPSIWVCAYDGATVALDFLREDDWTYAAELVAGGWAQYFRLPLLKNPRPDDPWEYAPA